MQCIQAILDTQKSNLKSIGQVNAYDNVELELEIQMNGKSLKYDNPLFELLAVKNDKTKVRQIENIVLVDNKIRIKCNEQITTCDKIVRLQLIIKDTDRISTCLFYMYVGKSLENEIIESINNVKVIEELENYVIEGFQKLSEYENKITEKEEQLNNIVIENDKLVVNEKERVEAEEIRNTNELKRIKLKESLESKLENGEFKGEKGDKGETGKQGIQGEKGDKGEKGEVGPPVDLTETDLKIQKTNDKIDNACLDFDGKKHSTLKKRIDTDLNTIYNRFNKATLLNYESENILANNSYKGVCENLIIKGKSVCEDGVLKSTLESGKNAEGLYPFELKSCGVNLFNIDEFLEDLKENIYVSFLKKNNENSLSIRVTAQPNVHHMEGCFKENTEYVFTAEKENLEGYEIIQFIIFFEEGAPEYFLGEENEQKIIGGNGKTIKYFTVGKGANECGAIVSNLIIQEKQDVILPYQSYVGETIPVLSPIPLKEIPNSNISDEIHLSEGVVLNNVDKMNFNGSEDWIYQDAGESCNLYLQVTGIAKNSPLFCNIFENEINTSIDHNNEGIGLKYNNGTNISEIVVNINKDKLSSTDVDGFKEWLLENNIEIYYKKETPIIHEISKVELKSYDGSTNITSNVLLKPIVSINIPSDVNSIIKTLQVVNQRLSMIIVENNLSTIALSLDQEERLTKLELGVI